MYRYERLLVAVNLKDSDRDTIRYAALVARMAQSKEVHFVHVAREPAIPKEIREKYPEVAGPLGAEAERKLTSLVDEHFDGPATSTSRCAVLDGSPLLEILRRTRKHDIDLVLVGRRGDKKLAGTLGEKLARKAPCSVLIVPQDSQPVLDNVLVALDFSEHAVDAVDVAVAFAAAAERATLHGVHIYEVPVGFYKTGKTFEQFGEIMKGHAVRHFEAFSRKQNLRGLSLEPLFVLDDRPSRGILQAAKTSGADLIVLGARGRGAGAAVLLGSVTERLIAVTDVPLLAVKKKGAGMSLLEALLEW